MFKSPLNEYLKNRSNLIEIIIVTILMAFSVGLMSGSITLLDFFKPIMGICVGLIISLCCLMYFFIRTFLSFKKNKRFEGFFLYDSSNNKLKDVYNYDFSNSITRYLNAAFSENVALSKQWEDQPLKSKKPVKRDRTVRSNSYNLICQVTEYYILKRICLCLTDYFNEISYDDTKFIKTYKRNEVPDILLSNKFFELFSKPMNERPLFSDTKADESIIFMSNNGTLFEQFELRLPNKSTIKRVKDRCIEIDTPRFKIEFEVDFDYTSVVLPRGFRKYYLGEKIGGLDRSLALSMNVNFKINFKFFSFLSLKGWNYYKWIDLLLKDLEEHISKDLFFENINWKTAHTILRCMENEYKQNREKETEKVN